MAKFENPRALTMPASEFAQSVGIDGSWMRRLIRDKGLPAVKVEGRWHVEVQTARTWIEQNTSRLAVKIGDPINLVPPPEPEPDWETMPEAMITSCLQTWLLEVVEELLPKCKGRDGATASAVAGVVASVVCAFELEVINSTVWALATARVAVDQEVAIVLQCVNAGERRNAMQQRLLGVIEAALTPRDAGVVA